MSDLTTPPLEAEAGERTVEETLARDLVERARTDGVELVGPGGLLTGLTKTVLETALEAELDDHLGYAKHASEGLGRYRWVVERTFAWLHKLKRLLVSYDRRAEIHEAFLAIGCCLVCFRRLQNSF